jgi:eukaryotic-like serine/threonine-protein kinase
MQTTRSKQAKQEPHPQDIFAGTSYRLVSRLGAGGMGEVFVVEHRELGREFVAKVLHAEFASDPRVVDRMRVERQALGRLNHPNVVSVVDSATLKNGRPFFVMERLRGQTLADELRQRGKLPVYEAVHFACELLSALAAAHAIGIVHRDIKPANLFICTLANGSRCLKVLDFGIARVLPDAPAAAPLPLVLPTDVGVMMGTPRFASPEAAVGQRVDIRADVYAAALMLYLMLAGRGPFDHHARAASVMAAHVVHEPAPPSKYATDPVPYPLDNAVLRGLRKDPSERFQSAVEFQTELEGTVALLRKPLGWVETTLFPPDKPSAPKNATPLPPLAAVLDDTSRDGTTFQMPAKPAPLADPASVQIDQRPSKLPASLVPFVLGMVVAGLIAAALLATVR